MNPGLTKAPAIGYESVNRVKPSADDFAPSSGPSSDTGNASVLSGPTDGGRAYTASEVEIPVGALGGARPEYPPSLRSSGMEGEVVAQFIVDESGRALAESVKIIAATHALYGESVRRVVPKMRFAAARIGSRAVPQLVQQLFMFRLDR